LTYRYDKYIIEIYREYVNIIKENIIKDLKVNERRKITARNSSRNVYMQAYDFCEEVTIKRHTKHTRACAMSH